MMQHPRLVERQETQWCDGRFVAAPRCRAPDLTVHPQRQAYTRLADRLYLFENLDGSDFRAELPVDEDGIVLDYPDLFRRVT